MAETDEPKQDVYRAPTFVTVIGTIIGLSTVFVIIAVMVWVGQPAPPPPREDLGPRRTLEEVRTEDQRLLTTYGWVDREQGVVHIPIEAAMETLVAESFQPGGRPDGVPEDQNGAVE